MNNELSEINELKENSLLEVKKITYSPAEFSAASGLSISSLSRDRLNGCLGGIPFIQMGGRILYPIMAIEQWLVKQIKHGQHGYLPNPLNEKRGRGRPAGTTKAFLKHQKTTLKQGSQL